MGNIFPGMMVVSSQSSGLDVLERTVIACTRHLMLPNCPSKLVTDRINSPRVEFGITQGTALELTNTLFHCSVFVWECVLQVAYKSSETVNRSQIPECLFQSVIRLRDMKDTWYLRLSSWLLFLSGLCFPHKSCNNDVWCV